MFAIFVEHILIFAPVLVFRWLFKMCVFGIGCWNMHFWFGLRPIMFFDLVLAVCFWLDNKANSFGSMFARLILLEGLRLPFGMRLILYLLSMVIF